MRIEDITMLEKLAEWMRKTGATRAKVGEVELELGSTPPAPTIPAPEPSDEEVIQAVKAQQEEFEALLYASSEGV